MAKILSISAVTHDCGVAYIEDGNIKYAFEEERFKRLKGVFNQFAFPDYSLKALGDLGISPFDDDVIVVMPKAVLCGLDYLENIVEKKDIFLYALEMTGARVEESIMIGDDLEVDIRGAKSIGMDQVFVNYKGLQHDERVTYEVNSLKELQEFF